MGVAIVEVLLQRVVTDHVHLGQQVLFVRRQVGVGKDRDKRAAVRTGLHALQADIEIDFGVCVAEIGHSVQHVLGHRTIVIGGILVTLVADVQRDIGGNLAIGAVHIQVLKELHGRVIGGCGIIYIGIGRQDHRHRDPIFHPIGQHIAETRRPLGSEVRMDQIGVIQTVSRLIAGLSVGMKFTGFGIVPALFGKGATGPANMICTDVLKVGNELVKIGTADTDGAEHTLVDNHSVACTIELRIRPFGRNARNI